MSEISFTVVTLGASEHAVPFKMDGSTTIELLKAMMEAQLDVKVGIFYHNGAMLQPSQTLASAGVQNGAMITAQVGGAAQAGGRMLPAGGAAARPAAAGPVSARSLEELPRHVFNDPIQFQQTIRSNSHLLQQLLHQNPRMAEACLSDDTTLIRAIFDDMRQRENQRRGAQADRIRRLNEDPMNPELQREIEEGIRKENVEHNMNTAFEHIPESFGRVIMLYVPCEVNGQKIKAFVDSGAQSTIMSKVTAEKLGIMRLVDTRWAGMAKGVGTAKIIGRVHLAQIKLGSQVLNFSITILENNSMEFLFGLDMLKRHQISIDLRHKCLRIPKAIGSDEEEMVPFLSEKDIPKDFGAEPTAEELKTPDAGGAAPMDTGGTSSSSSSSSSSQQPAVVPSSSSSASSSSSSTLVPQQPAAVGGGGGGGGRQFPADHVQRLVDLGATREEAIGALRMTGGDLNAAAGMFLG